MVAKLDGGDWWWEDSPPQSTEPAVIWIRYPYQQNITVLWKTIELTSDLRGYKYSWTTSMPLRFILQLHQIEWFTIQGMHQYVAQVTNIWVPVQTISWQTKADIQAHRAQIPSVYKACFEKGPVIIICCQIDYKGCSLKCSALKTDYGVHIS